MRLPLLTTRRMMVMVAVVAVVAVDVTTFRYGSVRDQAHCVKLTVFALMLAQFFYLYRPDGILRRHETFVGRDGHPVRLRRAMRVLALPADTPPLRKSDSLKTFIVAAALAILIAAMALAAPSRYRPSVIMGALAPICLACLRLALGIRQLPTPPERARPPK